MRPPYWQKLALLGFLCLAACRPDSQPRLIAESEVRKTPPISGQVLTSKERFSQAQVPQASPLEFQAPAYWHAQPTTAMRQLDFEVGEDGTTECYVALLPGSAGGVPANLNRWRRQLGATALSEQEIADLPVISCFGQEAALLSVSGDYTDMKGTTYPAYQLLAVVCSLPEQTAFVKLIGPESAVQQEHDAFIRFCASLQFALEETTP